MVPALAPNAKRAAPGPSTGPTEQLGLFPSTHPVVEALRAVDVNTLTPLAALQLVAELADRARC
jgi:hypothetical protein